MMSDILAVLTTSSTLAGVVSAGWLTLQHSRQTRMAKEEVRLLTEDSERQALQSNDIQQLGGYLYNNIGSTRLSNYVGNEEVRARISRALSGVLSYLGTEDAEIPQEDGGLADQDEDESDVSDDEGESEPSASASGTEMSRALEEITLGEVWNGLARMRRHIEIVLREIDPDLSRRSNQPLGRLLSTLIRTGQISERAEKYLRYAISVANSGIHGNDVSLYQAQEAWEAAVRGLALLSAATE